MNSKQILNSLKRQLPNERVIAKSQMAYTHADRKRFWTNFDKDLADRISEIKNG